jgi:hypothetical protein
MNFYGRVSKKEREAQQERDKDRIIPTDYLTGNIDIAKSPLEYLLDNEDYDAIHAALAVFEPRTKAILEMRFGFNGEAKTLKEIGKEFNVSGDRIREIEARALRRLKHPTFTKELRGYVARKMTQNILGYYNKVPARHYVPEWKRPVCHWVTQHRYRIGGTADFDMISFLRGKMTIRQLHDYLRSKGIQVEE